MFKVWERINFDLMMGTWEAVSHDMTYLHVHNSMQVELLRKEVR